MTSEKRDYTTIIDMGNLIMGNPDITTKEKKRKEN
jgi:hypothetical protein